MIDPYAWLSKVLLAQGDSADWPTLSVAALLNWPPKGVWHMANGKLSYELHCCTFRMT